MIRKLRPTELSNVMQIWLEANLEAHQFISAQYWHEIAEQVRKLLAAAEIYVYENEEDHKLAGFIGLFNNHIAGLFVHRAHRSSGVGKALIDYVKMSKAYLVLNVYRQNEQAYRFYRREGFKLSRTQTDPVTQEEEFEMYWEK